MRFFRPSVWVLMVCRENICRSPMAEALMRHHLQRTKLARRIGVSSAGTHASQPGIRADQRAYRLAKNSGVKLGRIRATKVTEKDILESDYIFAMDRSNLESLLEMAPLSCHGKITLLLSHLPGEELDEVPDPYYGSQEGFERVYHLIDRAVTSLVDGFFADPRDPQIEV